MTQTRDWLSDAEKRELTGYQRPTFQKRWLTENGIRHYIRKDGEIVIPRAALGERAPTHSEGELDFEPGQRGVAG